MNDRLFIFKNVSINTDGNYYCLFNDEGDFIQHLRAKDTMPFEFDVDSYQINDGYIRVKSDINLFYASYVVYRVNDIYRFYFVDSVNYISGFYLLNVREDIFANYIDRAIFKNIRITRCNRNIGVGIYDSIPATIGRPIFEDILEYNIERLSVVGVITYSVKQSLFTDSASTKVKTFVYDMADFPEYQPGAARDPVEADLLNVVEAIGGIYSSIEGLTNTDAQCIGLYLIPSELISTRATTAVTFQTQATGGIFDTAITLSKMLNGVVNVLYRDYELNPNFEYYFGAEQGALKLIRHTGAVKVGIKTVGKADGLEVYVTQGDKELDISTAFKVGITSNDANLTASEKISKTLGVLGGISSSIFQIASGGSGVVTGALTMANALNSAVTPTNAKYAVGGDGLSTCHLFNKGSILICQPLQLFKFASISDETLNADLNGVTFNEVITDLNVIFNSPKFNPYSDTETLISATLSVNNVPVYASEFIQNVFNRGCYVKAL